MHAIVSGLDAQHDRRVTQIWSLLRSGCGLSGMDRTPLPHFSWQISREYAFEALEPAIARVARGMSAFTVRTSGLGIFTGEADIVLYLALVRDAALSEMQAEIWHAGRPFGKGVSEHYAPQNWVPHITLGHADVDPEKLTCAVRHLSRERLHWEIAVDHLALVFQAEGMPAREIGRFPFDG